MSARNIRPRKTNRPITFLAGAVVTALVAPTVVGCGGGGSAATAATPKTSSGAAAIVGVSRSSLGLILVNSNDRALYLFKAGARMPSACTGACVTK